MVESHAVCEPLVSLFPLPLLSTPAYFCVDMEGLCHWLVGPPSLYTPNNIEIYLSLISIFGRALSPELEHCSKSIPPEKLLPTNSKMFLV